MKLAIKIYCFWALLIWSAEATVFGNDKTHPSEEENIHITFFQLNLWHECDKAPEAFNSLVDHVAELQPDIASFCELYRGGNDSGAVLPRLVGELAARGLRYHSTTGNGRGVISKFPVVDPEEFDDSVFKVRVMAYGRDIVVYSAHLNYRYYASYLPRGYCDGDDDNWEKISSPATDTERIINRAVMSGRVDVTLKIIEDAEIEASRGRAVILAGDFNEPSHLDWTEATDSLWDHNGCVIEWPVSSLLSQKGFTDCFREKYPDPVNNPGFTFPAGHPAIPVEELTWVPDADERERIDFIYCKRDSGLNMVDIKIVGPDSTVKRGVKTADPDRGMIITPIGGNWPSDHKGLIAIFRLDSYR